MKPQDNNWKIGDWCFCEYKLQQVKDVESDGRVTEISDGYFCLESRDLRDRMFRVTLHRKTLTEFIEAEYKKLNTFDGLNFPDLRQKYIQFHIEGCQLPQDKLDQEDEERDASYKEFYAKVTTFTNTIIDKAESHNGVFVDGVRVFRK